MCSFKLSECIKTRFRITIAPPGPLYSTGEGYLLPIPSPYLLIRRLDLGASILSPL